ncbi:MULTISPECIES: alpha-glucosidase [unclassified Novosphingobium]|uniref:glycoside hydrolase family 13 protein n=1 Tax=unclassified Novosphingobium TaxID=2644732 RepID=UPI0025F5BA06|nr:MULTISPECIES: alpha-glucosidase [unclassified Novosphingobium]HQS70561.1 alpha-glucosidase [Novosphingobium sp.]
MAITKGANALRTDLVHRDCAWWQSAVGYQIYPASFADSNGDGIGDIPGIIGKLDYLADLGIGFIWLSPVYASPMVDNGYDISDYRAINPIFGTMEDMDRLIAEARARNIGIVMDLVVNHTSDQHPWFRAAQADRQSPYRDYYIWRDQPPAKGTPADIEASFGGPAWTQDGECGDWYFHLFAPQQPDLNWTNPALRAAIHAMMNWWLEKGVAGFRMDVIDLIGKQPEQGIVADGPELHRYLREMHEATLTGRDAVTVGEAWSATTQNAPLYSAPERREVSMVFQFGHVTQFWDEKLGKWKPKPIDWPKLKATFATWQAALHGQGWNSLFWGNHDLPRAVSRYGDEGEHRVASAKALATILHLMEGTPYIYQGEEIGMTNAGFTHIEQYRDVETLNFHRIQLAQGVEESAFLAGARANSRDNARTPMQWSAQQHAGFTQGEPWISVNANYFSLNVEQDRADPNGVFNHYRSLIALRQEHAVIRLGDFRLLLPDHPALVAYQRSLGDDTLLVIANMSGDAVKLPVSDIPVVQRPDILTGTQVSTQAGVELDPYAAFAIWL